MFGRKPTLTAENLLDLLAQYENVQVQPLGTGCNWWLSLDYGGGDGGEIAGHGPATVIIVRGRGADSGAENH